MQLIELPLFKEDFAFRRAVEQALTARPHEGSRDDADQAARIQSKEKCGPTSSAIPTDISGQQLGADVPAWNDVVGEKRAEIRVPAGKGPAAGQFPGRSRRSRRLARRITACRCRCSHRLCAGYVGQHGGPADRRRQTGAVAGDRATARRRRVQHCFVCRPPAHLAEQAGARLARQQAECAFISWPRCRVLAKARPRTTRWKWR